MIGRIDWKVNEEGLLVPTFHCSVCGTSTEGFSLCLKCNPQTYTVIGSDMTDDSLNKLSEPKLGQPLKIVGIEKAFAPSVYEKEIWNKAIEAAALAVHHSDGFLQADTIRKLKK